MRVAAVVLAAMLCGAALHAAERPVTPAEAWKIGWPTEMGPNLNWSANPCGVKLVDDIDKVRHVWRSEERVPISKTNNAGDPDLRKEAIATIGGGSASPILADGRAYVTYWVPNGPYVDPIERYNGMRFWPSGLMWSFADRQAVEANGGFRKGCLEADDVVLCVDAASGRTLWKRSFTRQGMNYQSRKDDGIHASPCYAHRRVYALTTTCRLLCLDAVSGETVWESTAMADFPSTSLDKLVVMASGHRIRELMAGGHSSGYFGLAVIDGRLILRTAAGGLQAFDAATGNLLWTQLNAGIDYTHPLPFVWRHGGQTYLLGFRFDTATCTDAATGNVIWALKDVKVSNPTVAGDMLVGVMPADPAEKQGALILNGFRLTRQGLEHAWRADPATAGHVHHANFPSTAADGTVLAPRQPATGANSFDAMVRLDPQTGKVLAVYGAQGLEDHAHHLALCDLDDGWIWSKHWYRRFTYLRADGKTRPSSSLEQISDEGRLFNTAYSYPVNDAYAAGRMVTRGNHFLHGLDFRAGPPAEVAPDSIPAWAAKLSEPVRGMASRYRRDREAALAAWGALDGSGRSAHLSDLLKLLEAGDPAAELAAARALALPGLDAAKAAPAIRAALLKAVDAGRGEYAGLLAAALATPDAAVAERFGAPDPARVKAACAAVAGFGPAGGSMADRLVALADHKDFQLASAAMRALGAVDRKGASAERLVALLQHDDLNYRLAAADALGAMGPGAGAALGKITEVLNPIIEKFTKQQYGRANLKGRDLDDRLVSARLIWVLSRIGKDAVPLLAGIAEKTGSGPDKLVCLFVRGSLAQAGPEAMAVAAKWYDSDDKARQDMAIELVELMVRHKYPPAVLEPFCNARMTGAPTELTVRAAEWLLRADGMHAKALQVLVECCESDATPDLVRQLAAEALSRQVILPHNAMTDEVRRRGAKTLVGVIARGKASPIVIRQCAGLAPFLDQDDQARVQQAQSRMTEDVDGARIYIPYYDGWFAANPGD